MNIQEMKQAKLELGKNIQALITEFEDKTECCVENITLEHFETYNPRKKRQSFAAGIEVSV